MALGGIMLAFGINVSQFRAPVLPLPLHLLPLVFVWGILHECDLKIKQRVFSFSLLLLLRLLLLFLLGLKRINHSLEQRAEERERA